MKKYGRPLAIGVTPGKASMARKASPKAPGSCRTAPPFRVVWPGSGRSPWTVTSVTRASRASTEVPSSPTGATRARESRRAPGRDRRARKATVARADDRANRPLAHFGANIRPSRSPLLHVGRSRRSRRRTRRELDARDLRHALVVVARLPLVLRRVVARGDPRLALRGVGFGVPLVVLQDPSPPRPTGSPVSRTSTDPTGRNAPASARDRGSS
jgi:hypothetical protein